MTRLNLLLLPLLLELLQLQLTMLHVLLAGVMARLFLPLMVL
jgi:hypothetical protein